MAYDGTGIFAISDDSGTEVVVTFLRLGEYQQQVLFRLIGYVRQDSPQGSPKTPKAAKRRAGPAKTSPGIDKVALLKKELANAQRGADRQRKALRAACVALLANFDKCPTKAGLRDCWECRMPDGVPDTTCWTAMAYGKADEQIGEAQLKCERNEMQMKEGAVVVETQQP